MGNTLLEMDTRVVLNLGVSSDSTVYPKTNRRVKKINSVIDRICNWSVVDILAKQAGQDKVIKWWDLIFLKKREYIKDYASILTDEEVSSADEWGSIDCVDSSWRPTAWDAMINWDIINFTGNSSNQLTTTTGIWWTHASWSIAHFVHKVADDYNKSLNLFYVRKTDGKLIPMDFLNYKYQNYADTYWTVIWDSDDGRYLHLRFPEQWHNYWHEYFINPTVLSADWNETEIPGSYWVELVALLASWEMLWESEQRDQAKAQLILAYWMLEEFFIRYTSDVQTFMKKIKRDKRTSQHVYQRRS